ncbi:hypothetical protein L596_005611 [Steinernema carpocapsae]|uniref:G-protein coupled receptors family 1 profile domain-containing protein n=1 Tax=Steinernema carpocapsae TaxID=34508 RepID=A0A4U8UZK0_STECR|nr:hypothetical protein L596_005611 [Steinernema carpocapsae]
MLEETRFVSCECEPSADGSEVPNVTLILIFLPLLSLSGVIFNCISLAVFARKDSRQITTNIYLTVLSLSDMGICLSGIFIITADSLRSYSYMVNEVFALLIPKLTPFGMAFQMLSVYVTVLAAVDCYVSVSRKSGKSNYCKPDTAKKVLSVAVVIVCMYNLLVFWELKTQRCFDENSNTTKLEVCPTEMRIDETYITVYRGYMYTLSMAIIPFALLSTLTIGIVRNLSRGKWNHVLSFDAKSRLSLQSSMVRERPHAVMTKAQSDDSSTGSSPLMLVMVIGLFLACNVVSLVVNILEMTSDLVSFSAQMILIDIGNVLVVFNATANFFVYVIFSESYRASLKEIFWVQPKCEEDPLPKVTQV